MHVVRNPGLRPRKGFARTGVIAQHFAQLAERKPPGGKQRGNLHRLRQQVGRAFPVAALGQRHGKAIAAIRKQIAR